MDCSVIIIGAGIASLEAGVVPDTSPEGGRTDRPILLLKTGDRLGRRTLKKTHAKDNHSNNPVNPGVYWICPKQPAVFQLVQDLWPTAAFQENHGMRVRLPVEGGGRRVLGLTSSLRANGSLAVLQGSALAQRHANAQCVPSSLPVTVKKKQKSKQLLWIMAILFPPRVLVTLFVAPHFPSPSWGFIAPNQRATRVAL